MNHTWKSQATYTFPTESPVEMNCPCLGAIPIENPEALQSGAGNLVQLGSLSGNSKFPDLSGRCRVYHIIPYRIPLLRTAGVYIPVYIIPLLQYEKCGKAVKQTVQQGSGKERGIVAGVVRIK